ncbi:MAG: hypothetical protein IPK74_01495 [Deltaproteobacteria bacterium]|nr:hypothetical protein [Deltaproteobacteria bacterium]
MTDMFYRTEDIKSEDVLSFFVPTEDDRRIVDALKSRSPVVLVGSRGVGKSFLLRVAEHEVLAEQTATDKTIPIYVSFTKGSLVHTSDPLQFHHWMLARLCARIMRTFQQLGFLDPSLAEFSIIAGSRPVDPVNPASSMEALTKRFEDSWKNHDDSIPIDALPSVDLLKEAVEDLVKRFALSRLAIFFDEVAHIFRPDQQRQFFTLFRDLRSPYITCNAAVYPGVTSYGEAFQPTHDATFIQLDRDVLANEYLEHMRAIVEKQADARSIAAISRQQQNFAALAYAANGNPRLLLKTWARVQELKTRDVNELIREYYRTDIWGEHSTLVERYEGHRALIDWGRNFIESSVLPELSNRNAVWRNAGGKQSCFFWVHRDAPAEVREALRILAYTGIVSEKTAGVKGGRSEIGTRYAVSLGGLLAQEASPASAAEELVRNITVRRWVEYGKSHEQFQKTMEVSAALQKSDALADLQRQLDKPIDVLDLSDWQLSKLRELSLTNVRSVLNATEADLQKAYYVGEVRSRQMKNAAIAAVLEYLSG